MTYLLDTMTLSALMKPDRAPDAVRRFAGVDLDDLHVPAPALGELRRSIARLADGTRKARLEAAFAAELAPLLADCLAFDAAAAAIWGELDSSKNLAL